MTACDRGADRDCGLNQAAPRWWLADFMAFFGGSVSTFGIDALEDSVVRVLPRTD